MIPHIPKHLSETLQQIAQTIHNQKGRCLLVGGAVRDHLMSLPIKDIDIEIFGIPTYESLKSILSPFGQPFEVGKSFGVLKLPLDGLDCDFSFPRTETKKRKGHKGFDIHSNPSLSFKDAAYRRDFTINAMGIDLLDGTLHDPYNGQTDLEQKRLKHVSPAFVEDPLRVYRAIQFAARFNLTLTPSTLALCQSITPTLKELPKERIFEELKKLMLKAAQPSIGFKLMKEIGILPKECAALIDTPQDPEWHPEGTVWTHTLQVLDQMAQLRPDNENRALILMFSALCHDFGKPLTTQKIDGRWRSPGHESKGEAPTRSYLNQLTYEKKIIEPIVTLVKHHLKPALLYQASNTDGVSDSAIRRLTLKVPIQDLLILGRADHFGRNNQNKLASQYPAGEWLEKRTKALKIDKKPPQPILKGRHLIKKGIKPGAHMGHLLKQAFEAQLEGNFTALKGAIEWFESNNKTRHE